MPRTFAEMFEKQLGYQYLLDEGRELGEQEKVERIGRLALLQHGETHEQMDELGYRIHKRYKRPEWDNATATGALFDTQLMPSPIPEPTMMVLLGLGAAALLRTRKCRC